MAFSYSPLYCLQRQLIKRLMIFTDSTQDSSLTDALSKGLFWRLSLVSTSYAEARVHVFSEHDVARPTKLW